MLYCYIVEKLQDRKTIDQILELRNESFQDTYDKNIKDKWSDYDENSYHFLVYNEIENQKLG